ncbi:class I SAM-dependent methyltransferase [Spirilliplanes yamanashiensis]|nr:methyltransferase domain-containing protein [Spirilliplanes yamanashiensis]MDP9817104.1 SAM-dependent methyltransferase [Spirilliplanes yamanashiensis]
MTFDELSDWPAESLLIAAGVGPGTRVLDVGGDAAAGPGAVAGLAADRGARVTAAGPAAGPGAALPYPNETFDAAVANFAVHRAACPASAVRELRRVVRPGGRVAVTAWSPAGPPLRGLWAGVLAAAGVTAGGVVPAGDVARAAGDLAGLLRDAGLDDARCDTLTWTHRADPAACWAGLAATGPAGRDPAAVRRAYDEAVRPHLDGDGMLALPASALLGSGHTPAPHVSGAAVVAATAVSAR